MFILELGQRTGFSAFVNPHVCHPRNNPLSEAKQVLYIQISEFLYITSTIGGQGVLDSGQIVCCGGYRFDWSPIQKSRTQTGRVRFQEPPNKTSSGITGSRRGT